VDNFSYQEKSSNHKGEKIPIVLFSNTVIKPLQNPSKSFRSGYMIYQPISKEKKRQIKLSYSAMMIKAINTLVTNSTVLAVLEDLHQHHSQ
jgi:hypothetical protein